MLSTARASKRSRTPFSKVEDFASKKLGEDKAEKVSKVRDAIDRQIGDE